MSQFISERMNLIQPSPTLAITALANKLKSEGKDVVGFGAGEPDFDTPEHIKEAARNALAEGKTKYAPVPGIPELKEAIRDKFKRDNSLEYSTDSIIVGTGGKQILYNLFQAVINEGDEVIFPAPYWVSYKDMVNVAGGRPVIIKTDYADSYKLSAEQLRKAITPDTKVFLMNSPSNPTGVMYSQDEIEEIAAVLEEYSDLLIVTDDIYEHLVYDDNTFTNPAMVSDELKKRTVVVNGLSKAYSMTGWRLGYAASDQVDIIKAMSKLQGQSTSGANTFAQFGAVAALNGDQSCIDEMKKAFIERRDFIVEALRSIQGVNVFSPQGAFYVFPDISDVIATDGFKKLAAGSDETDPGKILAATLLEKYLVAVVPGIAFGYSEGFRMSYATSMEQIKKGMQRIGEFFESLAG